MRWHNAETQTPSCETARHNRPQGRLGIVWQAEERGETSQDTLTSSKKHKSGTEDVIWVSDSSSSSTPSLLLSATTTAKSIPTLIGELWDQETKRYEARILELQKQEHNSASLLEAYRREVQAARQQSADFKAKNELLEGEIATLKAGNVRLEERVGATRKVLEGLKSKFLVKVIQATDEIMTDFDELGAQ